MNGRKRPSEETLPEEPPMKRRFVSASSVRNYMLEDPLLDFLAEYSIKKVNDLPVIRKNNSGGKRNSRPPNSIQLSGIEFEKKIIEEWKKNHPIVQVCNSLEDYYSDEKRKLTISLINQNVPVIYQALLIDEETGTAGMPDILVRNDYIKTLIEGLNIEIESNKFYSVIDIKSSTIFLRKDGTISNIGSTAAYKGQLYIYLSILNKIQKINSGKAYIFGRRYLFNRKRIYPGLAVIDYSGSDKDFVGKTQEAIKWVKELREKGKEWKLFPTPTREELYPNMKNSHDEPYHQLKKELSSSIGEITSIWYCGIQRRKIALSNGIKSWKDESCNSTTLGFNPSKISTIVDKILWINRHPSLIIHPEKIDFERDKWENNSNKLEIYLDFETISSEEGSKVFLIGFGINKEGWNFSAFLAKDLSHASEKKIFIDSIEKIEKELINSKKKEVVFYHWSPAEVSIMKGLIDRNKIPISFSFSFLDLCRIFTSQPIVVKGALNYSLKSIAGALHSHSLIPTKWESDCTGGLEAMMLANNIYNKGGEEKDFRDIIKYNETDCRVLFDIHQLLKGK